MHRDAKEKRKTFRQTDVFNVFLQQQLPKNEVWLSHYNFAENNSWAKWEMGKVPMTHGSVLPEWGHVCMQEWGNMELKIRDLQYHGTVFFKPLLWLTLFTLTLEEKKGNSRNKCISHNTFLVQIFWLLLPLCYCIIPCKISIPEQAQHSVDMWECMTNDNKLQSKHLAMAKKPTSSVYKELLKSIGIWIKEDTKVAYCIQTKYQCQKQSTPSSTMN